MTTKTLMPATMTPQEQISQGKVALREIKMLVMNRPEKDKLIIKGRQYLFSYDWQLIGWFFGITAKVVNTEEIIGDRQSQTLEGVTFKDTLGYKARAVAIRDGMEICAGEAECRFDEEVGGKRWWSGKTRSQLLSMAQTRACAKALRNCLSWVVRLPDVPTGMAADIPIASEASAEEAQGSYE